MMLYCPCCGGEMQKVARALLYCGDCDEHFDEGDLADKYDYGR